MISTACMAFAMTAQWYEVICDEQSFGDF